MTIIIFWIVLILNIDIYELFIVNKQFMGISKKTLKGINKKDRKQFFKNCKNLRQELRDYIDPDLGPWCDCTLGFLDIQIKYWIKYYSLDYNVWSMEDRKQIELGYKDMPEDGILPPTRLEIAKHLQLLLYRYCDFQFGLTDAELLEYESNPDAFPSGLLKNRMKDFYNSYKYINNGELVLDYDKMNEDYKNCKKELFDYYYKYGEKMVD